MARALLPLLADVQTGLHASMTVLRAQAPTNVTGNREQRRGQARELRRRIEQTSSGAADLIEGVRQRVAEAAAREAREQLRASVGQASTEALHRRLETRTVRTMLESAGGEAADRIDRILLRGVTRELTPEVVRDQILSAVGGGATPSGLESRALLIARTELAHAERAGIFAAMEADRNVSEWVWTSRLSSTTCPYCWSMHGTVHPLSEQMATHPACLCRPQAHRWRSARVSGEDRFAALDRDQQREILGPAAFEAYRTGLITLPDLRATSVHPELGPVGGTASLSSVVGRDETRELLRAALRR